MAQQTAMQNLIEKIKEKMNLIPDDPNLTERGMYDAYLNCLRWAEECLLMEKEQQMVFVLPTENAAEYIDRHIVESMKELAKEGFVPEIKNK
jgi:hypothetical protein